MSPFLSKAMSPMTVLNGLPDFMTSATFLPSVDARLLRRVGQDLGRRVGVERVGFRLEVLRLELGDDVLRVRVLARIRREGHERAVGAGAGDRGELGRHDAVARHHRGVEALVAHLADDEAGFGVETAEIDDVDASLLQLRNESGIVLLARC